MPDASTDTGSDTTDGLLSVGHGIVPLPEMQLGPGAETAVDRDAGLLPFAAPAGGLHARVQARAGAAARAVHGAGPGGFPRAGERGGRLLDGVRRLAAPLPTPEAGPPSAAVSRRSGRIRGSPPRGRAPGVAHGCGRLRGL